MIQYPAIDPADIDAEAALLDEALGAIAQALPALSAPIVATRKVGDGLLGVTYVKDAEGHLLRGFQVFATWSDDDALRDELYLLQDGRSWLGLRRRKDAEREWIENEQLYAGSRTIVAWYGPWDIIDEIRDALQDYARGTLEMDSSERTRDAIRKVEDVYHRLRARPGTVIFFR